MDKLKLEQQGIKRVCKSHYKEVTVKEDRAGKRRFYCKTCKTFKFYSQIAELPAQLYYILERLNSMDNELGRIWDLAYHHLLFEKLPPMGTNDNYGLPSVFVAIHEAQAKIVKSEATSAATMTAEANSTHTTKP